MASSTASSAIASREITLDELRAYVGEHPGRLYAVLDACNQPLVLEKAEAVGDRAVCLYGGKAREDFQTIAPFVLSVDEELLAWIVEKLWVKPWWGILLIAPISLPDVRLHLLRFLKVRGPNDESWYFRFYDPRVLPNYLATCTDQEAKTFFGPIMEFLVNEGDSKLAAFAAKKAAKPT